MWLDVRPHIGSLAFRRAKSKQQQQRQHEQARASKPDGSISGLLIGHFFRYQAWLCARCLRRRILTCILAILRESGLVPLPTPPLPFLTQLPLPPPPPPPLPLPFPSLSILILARPSIALKKQTGSLLRSSPAPSTASTTLSLLLLFFTVAQDHLNAS